MIPSRASVKWDSDLYGKLLRLALPIVAANLLQTMYNLADTFFLGKLGKEAVSAPSIALNIFSFLIVFGFGFASAGTTLIAQSVGKRDREKADFYLGQMTTLMTVTSVLIAAFGIGNRIIGLFNLPAQGLASANAVLVGQKLGAKEPEKAKAVVMMSMVTITVFISLGMVYTFFRGSGLVRFFINDPEVIGHGARLFRMFSPSVVFFAIFTVITGAFQGGGDTKPVMILSIARLWLLRVPLAVLLSRTAGMGAEGIWMAMFVSNTVIAAAGFLFLSTGRWLRRLDPDTI